MSVKRIATGKSGDGIEFINTGEKDLFKTVEKHMIAYSRQGWVAGINSAIEMIIQYAKENDIDTAEYQELIDYIITKAIKKQ